MKRAKVLLGGDWNEPPRSTGEHSAKWIAAEAGLRVVSGQAGSMGRIDFILTDLAVPTLRIFGNGGSDHDLRWFLAPNPHTGGSLLGAIWNAERDRRPAVVAGFLGRFIRELEPDFVLLQEIQQYHEILGRFPGYRLLALPGRGINQNGILVRDGVEISGFRVKRMAPWTWRTAAGVEHAPPYMPHVLLDGWLRVASVHEMSQIDWRDGKMVGPRDRKRIRRVSAERMVKWVANVRAGVYDR